MQNLPNETSTMGKVLQKLKHWFLRLYYLLRRNAVNLNNYPQRITVCITGACQLQCSYCSRQKLISEGIDHETNQITEQQFKKIVEAIPATYNAEFSYGGVGEPTLHPQFFSFAEYARNKLTEAKIVLYTNGNQINRTLQHRSLFDLILCTLHPLTKEDKLLTLEIKNPKTKIRKYPMHNFGVYPTDRIKKRYPCSQPFHHLYITIKGNVYACCMGTTAEALEDKSLLIGKFRSIEQTRKSIKYSNMIESQLTGDLPSFCVNCDVYSLYPNFWIKHKNRWH